MREIKFRVWDIIVKEMLYPKWQERDGLALYIYESQKKPPNHSSLSWVLKKPEYIPMQYIGRKDCKRTEEFPEGQEIYEGDIAQCTHGWLGIIRYMKSRLHYACEEIVTKSAGSHGPIFDEWEELEVIGNIYEEKPDKVEVT